MSERENDEEAREEVRDKLRHSMHKLVGDHAKPVEEQPPEERGVQDAPPAPITKSG